jgi:hypothetical protein
MKSVRLKIRSLAVSGDVGGQRLADDRWLTADLGDEPAGLHLDPGYRDALQEGAQKPPPKRRERRPHSQKADRGW